MVIINTTGKRNEVWLDKPYGTIIVDCPDCPDTGDTWDSGYTSGYTDGLNACSGNPEDWQDGYDSGHTDGFQDGYDSGRTDGYNDGWGPGYDSGFTDGHESGYTDGWQPGYDSGFTDGYNSAATGNPGYEEGFSDGHASGITEQKNKLTSTAITQNGTYTREDGFNSVYVNVAQTGYTQADLDAAYQSGITYQKSLLTSTAITGNGIYTSENGFNSVNVSVICPSSGSSKDVNVLDFVYETSASNQTINLFLGEAQNNSEYFYAFLSALTYMEIDGQTVLPDVNNVYEDAQHVAFYRYTFASPGLHNVKYLVDTSFSAQLHIGTKYPAYELTEIIFYSDSINKVPVVTANIGNGYETLKMGVFAQSETLTAVTLPSTIIQLFGYVFEMSALKQVTCYATVPPTCSADIFRQTALEHIYVPAESVNAYKTATNWSDYASIIEAIQ